MSFTIDPETLFLAYAAGCAETRKQRGLITSQDYEAIMLHVTTQTRPSVPLLMRCFPDAYQALCRTAAAMQVDVWTIQAVARYWRQQHEGNSPVWRATVLYQVSERLEAWKVRKLGSRFDQIAFNPRRLALVTNDGVYIHMSVIAEQVQDADTT